MNFGNLGFYGSFIAKDVLLSSGQNLRKIQVVSMVEDADAWRDDVGFEVSNIDVGFDTRLFGEIAFLEEIPESDDDKEAEKKDLVHRQRAPPNPKVSGIKNTLLKQKKTLNPLIRNLLEQLPQYIEGAIDCGTSTRKILKLAQRLILRLNADGKNLERAKMELARRNENLHRKFSKFAASFKPREDLSTNYRPKQVFLSRRASPPPISQISRRDDDTQFRLQLQKGTLVTSPGLVKRFAQ